MSHSHSHSSGSHGHAHSHGHARHDDDTLVDIPLDDEPPPTAGGHVVGRAGAPAAPHSHSHSHSHSQRPGKTKRPRGESMFTAKFLNAVVRGVLADRTLFRLSVFSAVLLCYCVVEFVYGVMSDSLALIADSWYTVFSFAAMATRLLARMLYKYLPADPNYSFGFARTEIVLGFVGGVSALFVALFLVFESVEHFLTSCFEGPEEYTVAAGGDTVFTLVVCGLAIKLVGVLFFYEHMRVRAETVTPYAYPGEVWRHIIVDAVCSLSVIFNCWLVKWRHGVVIDALVAFLIAMLMFGNAVPVAKTTGRILLQTTPQCIADALHKASREAATCEGVLECKGEHFWTVAPGVFAGSVAVRVRSDASSQRVLDQVRRLFAPYVRHLTIEIEKDGFSRGF